jgi:hypothetical protein
MMILSHTLYDIAMALPERVEEGREYHEDGSRTIMWADGSWENAPLLDLLCEA